MTIGEFFVCMLMVLIFVTVMIVAVTGSLILIAGLPLLVINLYRNHKNRAKISFKEILVKTYF